MKSEETPATFDEAYFRTAYRDYARQNPKRKLDFYESIAQQARGGKTSTLLDLGCGLGAFLGHLRSGDPTKQAWRLVGTDVSEFAIARNQLVIPDVEFYVRRIEEEPLDGLKADIVTAFDVLEHLDNPDRAAEMIRSTLRPGGSLVLVVPVYDGPLGPLVTLADHDATHLQRKSRTWWLDWTARFFEVTDWLGMYRGMTPWRYYAHLPSRRWRRWSPAILVAARRP
ncbi:MAG: class I SAM-dependent methyltransferase [Acidimicrobiia bacterium]